MKYNLNIYFGIPGCGKSTYAAKIARECNRKHIPVFSNFPILGTYEYTVNELGVYQINEAELIIDEAGIEFNNREFKTFSKENLKFFKLHRHYKVNIDLFSQTYNDMDKKIRDLATNLYIVRRSIIPYFVTCIPIKKKIGIDDTTKQITEIYSMGGLLNVLFGSKRAFMPQYWKYFNSYDAPKLEVKQWNKYTKKEKE